MSSCCSRPRCTCRVTAGPGITVDGDGSAGSPFIVSGAGGTTVLQAVDSPTVDVTVAGTGAVGDPYTVAADAILDPAPPGGGTNLLGSGPDGLFVECDGVRGCLSAGDGAGYDPATGEITARLSTDPGNATAFGGDGGLYSPAATPTGLAVTDTPTVDLGLTGTGAAGDPYTVTGAVRLDATPPGGGTNLIGTGPDGLFVECDDVRGCFSAGNGAGYDPATGVITARLSTDAGNTTVFGGDGGLFTPASGGAAPTVVQAGDSPTVDTTVTGTGTVVDPYVVGGSVILEPTPPGGGAQLIQSGPGGLSLECDDVRGCVSAGDGAAYDPVTGVITARLSADAGNAAVFGGDTGLFVPAPALPLVGCGLVGDGTAAAPITVVPAAGQEAWPWPCAVAEQSTLKCDPATGALWTPPEHYSAMDHIYVDHFIGGWADPIVPSGGWAIISPSAIMQFVIPPNFVGNMCRTWGYEVNASGTWDINYTANATFEVGYAVMVDGAPATVRPLWGPLSPIGAARRERANGSTNATYWGLPATSGAQVVFYPAVNVLTGSLTINQWISDGTIHTTTNTP